VRILAFSGPSGAGKTRLLVRLIPTLIRRGVSVAALKHTSHAHDLDRRGKDSERLRRAGARAVAIQGPLGLAFFGPPVRGVRALAQLLPPVDLVLAEGFRSEPLPRIEVHRRAVSPTFLCDVDRRILAVVSDEAPPRAVPVFSPGEVDALADFLCRHFRLGHQGRALAGAPARVHPWRTRGPHAREMQMPRSTTKKGTRSTSRSRSMTGGRSSTGRGATTVREAGRKGGQRTLRSRGSQFYSEIGKKGSARGAKKGGQRMRKLVATGEQTESHR
jgi:molybdopterin-guanine dinucleotide biosynthesis protein B